MPWKLNIVDLMAAAAAFGLMLMVTLAVVVLWWRRSSVRARGLEERLGLPGDSAAGTRVLRLWREGREVTTTVPSEPRRARLWLRLERLGRDAGWEVPAQTLVLSLAGMTGLVVAVALLLTRSVPLALLAGATVPMIFWLILQRRVNRRAALFEKQLVDALQTAARSLRAGHPLLGAFRLVAEDLTPPISTVFAEICQQQQLGASMEAALRTAGDESNCLDMKLFATSVAIQLRSGGNLADMMDRVALVIRERIRLMRRARVLTAQTQFSKRILLVLPFILFVILNVMQPDYMNTLYRTQTGKWALALAGALLLAGVWVMNRLSRLED